MSNPLTQNFFRAWIDVAAQRKTELLGKWGPDGRKFAELMKERRTALISAAVPGKIDVRKTKE